MILRRSLGALAASCALAAGVAQARSVSEVGWSPAECYSAALRFVAVDRGCKIIDKDPEAAFLSFECTEGERSRKGALEIFKAVSRGGSGGEVVRLQVLLGDQTHGEELRFLELLERKLRDERGIPVRAAAPVKSRSRDGGT